MPGDVMARTGRRLKKTGNQIRILKSDFLFGALAR